jgi:RNA polymerase sigma-70 factor (ECF subfamily)
MAMPGTEDSHIASAAAITRIVREEAGRLTASLVRLVGDFEVAEDLVQDALVAALEHWPRDGLPERPGAWLLTTARRLAVDRWRREADYRKKVALLESAPVPGSAEVDDRLRLIFTCCHPALAREAQVALTLRAVLGLTTSEIARAFLVSEVTLAQRIVRAKRKIVAARIAYRMPTEQEMPARLNEVLTVLYVLFNEGYLSSSGQAAVRQELMQDAEWLASLVVRFLPDQPEALGLLALIRLHRARSAARFDVDGHLIVLCDQIGLCGIVVPSPPPRA